jgi:LmbE family N-acetylglucosaminyl deacetylase
MAILLGLALAGPACAGDELETRDDRKAQGSKTSAVESEATQSKSSIFELQETLRQLRTTARLLHTTAHPDDEDGAMLTLEARGRGVSAEQLTLNRGEGGQNKMGANLLDVLGILRTLELLAADSYYGVEQRFTRVADFGFSKTAEETFEKWQGHDIALGDMVRVIRTFRPDVIVSRFQGVPKDGHGHHQAAGILTREAFQAAADPKRFPEQISEGLAPWQAKKLYVDNARPPEKSTLVLDAGVEDPLLGTSYARYAMQGLKHQLSQGAGAWNVSSGPTLSYYRLVDSVLPSGVTETQEEDFFDGIDTSLTGLAERLGEQARVPFLEPGLRGLEEQVRTATAAAGRRPLTGRYLEQTGSALLAGVEGCTVLIGKIERAGVSASAKADLLVNLRTKQEQFQRGANLALGLEVKAIVDAPIGANANSAFVAVPGQSFTAMVTARVPEPGGELALDVPRGWRWKAASGLKRGTDGEISQRFEVDVPQDAEITKPYWHRDNPETDAVYTLDEPQYATLPFPPPPVHAVVRYKFEQHSGEARTTVDVRYSDELGAEKRMPVAVAPPISVAVEPAMSIIPTNAGASDLLKASVRKNISEVASVELKVEAPQGWLTEIAANANGADPVYVLTPSSSQQAQSRRLPETPRLPEERTRVAVAAVADGHEYRQGYTVVARADLGAFPYYQPSVQRVSMVRVNTRPGLKVGYLMGAGDAVPDVLRQIGVNVREITAAELDSGDLSKYDTIVLGIRAYDTREEVRRNNARLLDFAKAGGTLVVQYNSGMSDFNAGNYTPYPAQLSRQRVTVEEAPVEMLAPNDLVFHTPNEIAPSDFDGWVQERGLYFMGSWDEHYEPLLASHDPGEPEMKGGLLRARYGKGVYIYTGYSFFRELPAGVPGAIRLFVNLVSAR